MSGRALLSIGCDSYEHLDALTGAENDARGIYETLIRPEVGDYDAARSHLLLSPSLQAVRDALTSILFDEDAPDTLTIAFAGHGAVSGGSFYMAMRDSRGDALSATALSLGDLLRMIAEAVPAQTYLIIDACQAGGLIADLNVILKSDIMGRLGTPGVTLLATAASNESALENSGSGVGTAALLECVRGDIFLQDSAPALDLVEIGRAVSHRVSQAGGQTPVVWGLNLYGPPSFCKNPHASTGNAPLRSVLVGWPDAATAEAIRDSLPRLWEPYVAIASRWDPREFLDRLSPILSDLEANPDVLTNFDRRIAEACAVQSVGSPDRFREIEVRATCTAALLPFSGIDQVAAYISMASAEIGVLVEAAIADALAAISNYQFALVTGGMADLYYLPIRISKLLGWAGFAVHARLIAGQDPTPATATLADLFASMFEHYPLSLVSMSDCQAPYLMIAVTAAAQVGLTEQAEQLLSHMLATSLECGGRVAKADLEPDSVLNYLLARHNQQLGQQLQLVAQPTELMTALLRATRLVELSDELDTVLEELDHLTLNAYLPDDYRQFAENLIEGGTNAVYQVGHDFWRIAELEQSWPPFPYPESAGAALASLMACLIFPDRSPWFLMPLPERGENNTPESAG